MDLPVNTLLQGGKYRIVRFIGSGGFGCTYEAEHVMLEKRVAIKEFFVKDFCNRDEMTACVTVGTESKRKLVDKLKRKNLDFIVLNSLKDEGAGFQCDTNKVSIIDKQGTLKTYPLKSKQEVAVDIVEQLAACLN